MLTAAAILVLIGLTAALLVPRVRRGDSRHRDILLFLVAFTYPLREVSILMIAGGNVRIGDVFILLAAVAMAVEWLFGDRRIRLTHVDVLLALFVLWCFFTITWSLDPSFGVTRALKYARDLLLYAVVVYLSRDRFRDAFRAVSAGVMLSFVCIVAVVILRLLDGSALMQLASGIDPALDLDRFRGAGGIGAVTFAHEGSVLAVAFWTNAGIFFWLAQGGWMSVRASVRLFFFLVLAALFMLELVTFARGAWLALAAAGLWWFVRIGRDLRRRLLVPAAVLVVASSLLAYRINLHPALWQRVTSSVALESDPTIASRIEYWRLSLDVLEQHPMGVGIGGTKVAIAQQSSGMWLIHNVYLQLLVELGPVGFALAISAIALAIVRALRATHAIEDVQMRLAVVSVVAAILSYLVMGLTWLDLSDLMIWLLLALAGSVPGENDA